MNSIFRELLYKGVLANYMDSFIILARTMKELEKRTIIFLKIMEKYNFCFKRSKYNFNIEEIPILDVVVGKEQDKIKVVKEWKMPMKIKKVESFLEFTNFYRKFIQNFSHTAKPLNKLKGKKEWAWTEKHQWIFKELKEKITSQFILFLLKREGEFRVEMDVSKHAIRGVLSQKQKGKWKLIVFLPKMMQPVEKNYEIYNKKLLAIMKALTKQRQYLLNATEKFEVWTNHENLKYFRKPQKLNGRQVRQYPKLQDYNFILQYIPEKTNIKVDILSRKDQVNTQNNNKDVQLLKEKLWNRRTIAEIAMLRRNSIIEKTDLLKEIQQNGTKEQEVIQELKKEDRQAQKDNRLEKSRKITFIGNTTKTLARNQY